MPQVNKRESPVVANFTTTATPTTPKSYSTNIMIVNNTKSTKATEQQLEQACVPHSESTNTETAASETPHHPKHQAPTNYISYKSISNESLNSQLNSPTTAKIAQQQQPPFYLQPATTTTNPPNSITEKESAAQPIHQQKFTSVQDRILQFQSQLNRSNQKTPTATFESTSSPRVVKIFNSDRRSPPDTQQNVAFQKNLSNIKEAMSPKLNNPTDFMLNNKTSIPVQYQTSPVTPYQQQLQQQYQKSTENLNNFNTVSSTTIQINSYANPNNQSNDRSKQQQQNTTMMSVKKRVDTIQNSPGYESVASDQEDEQVVVNGADAVAMIGSTHRQPQRNLRSQRMQERNIRHGGFQVRNIDYQDSDSSDYDTNSDCSNEQRDNEDEEETDNRQLVTSSLAAKVQRIDSLSRFLRDRPKMNDLIDKNILPAPESERKVNRSAIEIKLDRKLSLRPTPKELEQRNILHTLSQDELKKQIEETKKMLVRKLSYRPTIAELREKRIIRFYDYIEVTEVEDYDRRADKPWTRLTPRDKAMIRNELNLYKSTEMEVHEQSRHLIRFHKPWSD